jgi:uncharacterized membrane-anchored protein
MPDLCRLNHLPLVFAAKFWKLLIVAASAVGAFVKKLLSGRKKEEAAATIPTE